MASFSFATSALLAVVGIALGVSGIEGSDLKQAATGLILILGAAVFAQLYIGLRRPPSVPRGPDATK